VFKAPERPDPFQHEMGWYFQYHAALDHSHDIHQVMLPFQLESINREIHSLAGMVVPDREF
jgi:hypothetical protein